MKLRLVVGLLLGLCGCDAGPPPSLIEPNPPYTRQVACVRGMKQTVVVVLCDLADNPEAYRRFVLGELVPERELRLRRSSPLRFGQGAEVPIEARRLDALRANGSFLAAHDDLAAEHRIPGWALFDHALHLALLLVGVDERLGIIASEFPAASTQNSLRTLAGFDFDQSFAELGRRLSNSVKFSMAAP